MPSGIIMQSGSIGATQESIEKVFEKNGLEFEKPEPEAAVEPKREDFKSDEEFETAQTEFETKNEEAEAKREEEEERKRQEQEQRHPKMSRRQKAVDAATRELREKNRQLEERLAALEGKKPEPVREELKAPKREDFKTDEEFEEARFDYRYQVRRAKEAQDEAQKQNAKAQKELEEHQKEMVAQYTAAKDEIKEEYQDWDDVLAQFGDLAVSQTVYMTILSLEEGPRVSYYLAKHPDTLKKLNGMFPDAAMKEVVRLHDRLKTGPADRERTSQPPKPRTKLPEPVRPLSTSASASTLTSREAAAARDFRAFKRAQARGN